MPVELYSAETKIVCDTSFIISLVEKRLFDTLLERYTPIKILIPRSVWDELARLASRGGRYRKARVAYTFLIDNIKMVEIVESKYGVPDRDVIETALDYNAIVASSDREVRREAMKMGLKTMYIRGGNIYIS